MTWGVVNEEKNPRKYISAPQHQMGDNARIGNKMPKIQLGVSRAEMKSIGCIWSIV